MARPVNTVAKGGLPVVDNTGLPVKHIHGIAVSEAPPGFGMAVTKVAGGGAGKDGQPVIYVTPTPAMP